MAEVLRLGLIPSDDAKLRSAAIAAFIADERENNSVPDSASDSDRTPFEQRMGAMSDIAAHTAGGIAWKIAAALDHWESEENWEWWRYLLLSTLIDAVELERRRLADKTKATP
jgi:hypothetical protein